MILLELGAAGLVNWIVTTIIVESEIGRPLRDWVHGRRLLHAETSLRAAEGTEFATQDDLNAFVEAADRGVWRWADFLLRCHLCTGTWVAIAEAIYLGRLVGAGILAYAFTALLIKAIGHLVLELRPQAWYGAERD